MDIKTEIAKPCISVTLSSNASHLEEEFLFQLRAIGLPEPQREAVVIPGRRFRWDFCWPEHKLLIEIQGGTWSGGAHGRGKGIHRDFEKINLAVLHGWRVLQFDSPMVRSGEAVETTRKVMEERYGY